MSVIALRSLNSRPRNKQLPIGRLVPEDVRVFTVSLNANGHISLADTHSLRGTACFPDWLDPERGYVGEINQKAVAPRTLRALDPAKGQQICHSGASELDITS